MTDKRKKLGDFGEQAALGYLSRQGLHEVARKWRCSNGEIDLVMRENDVLVFVEVRTRHREGALESVGPHKQARLVALAYTYLETHALADTIPWRIDVLAITMGTGGRVGSVEWVRSAVGEE